VITIFVTGGIGSGKSTLMRFFESKGAGVVYADEVGHENLHNEAMKEELRDAFGAGIFDDAGEVVRPKLAACAFSSADNTAKLDCTKAASVTLLSWGRPTKSWCSKWPFSMVAMISTRRPIP